MKKKLLAVLLTLTMSVGMLAGCGNQSGTEVEETVQEEEKEVQEENEEAAEEPTEEAEVTEAAAGDVEADNTAIRIASLKGPTSMGLVKLMDEMEKGTCEGNYEFSMSTAADEILPQVIQGNIDIALIPANVASVLYNKTQGQISVIDINTLGVLYMVSGDKNITSVADLSGKTIYLTGKGTTPDYVLQYLLAQNGITLSDVTLEYKSEATEVAAVLSENPDAIGLLPQPFVTVACAQNEALSVVINCNAEWEAAAENGTSLVTGVTVVRNEFLQNHPEVVKTFMEEQKASAAFANENVEEAAELVAAAGIIEKAPIAQKAMPLCNITYIDGTQMQEALAAYLKVLFDQNPEAVGGTLPADEFYYILK